MQFWKKKQLANDENRHLCLKWFKPFRRKVQWEVNCFGIFFSLSCDPVSHTVKSSLQHHDGFASLAS